MNVQAVLGGDYILICASQMLAKIGNTEVISIFAELINDLIKGEFPILYEQHAIIIFIGEIMQLMNFENIDEKLSHYYQKTYRKTASLIANCCKAVISIFELFPEMLIHKRTYLMYGSHLIQQIDWLVDMNACTAL